MDLMDLTDPVDDVALKWADEFRITDCSKKFVFSNLKNIPLFLKSGSAFAQGCGGQGGGENIPEPTFRLFLVKKSFSPPPDSQLSTFAEVAAHIHIGFAFAERFALIGVGFALTVGDFQFYQSGFQVHFERNQCSAFGRKLLVEFPDFSFVQQETAGAFDLVIETVAETVNGYMHIVKKCLSVFDLDIAFAQLDCPVAAAFDFGTGQLDTCLKLFNDRIIVKSLSIRTNN